MRTLYVLSLLLVSGLSLFAQDPSNYNLTELDSILAELKAQKRYGEMMPYALAGIEKGDKLGQNQDTIYANFLYLAGFSHHIIQDIETAKQYYNKAIRIQAKEIPNSKSFASSLNNLAAIYFQEGEYRAAEPLFLQAKEIYKVLYGVEYPYYLNSLNNLAVVYQNLSQYSKAEPMLLEVIELRAKILGKSDPAYATAVNNLGLLYDEWGYDEKAEDYIKTALKILRKQDNWKTYDYVLSLNALASLYQDLGRFEEAESIYLEALSIQKELENSPLEGLPMIYNNLGALYNVIEDLPKSEKMYQKAINYYLQQYGNQHPLYALSLTNLAHVHKEKAEFEKALELEKKALLIYEKTYGLKNFKTIKLLIDIAESLKALASYDKAIEFLDLAEHSTLEVYGKDIAYYFTILNRKQSIYITLDELEQALKLNDEALAKNTNSSSSINIKTFLQEQELALIDELNFLMSLRMRFNILKLQNATTSSLKEICQLALKLLRKQTKSFSNDSDQIQTLLLSWSWIDRYMSILDQEKELEEAFEIAEQGKAVLLLDALKKDRAYNFGGLPREWLEAEEALLKEQKVLKAELQNTIVPTKRDSLRSLLNIII
jgi:tetratricopeptide (TPR) repeat protein